jgi:hypothetical protein
MSVSVPETSGPSDDVAKLEAAAAKFDGGFTCYAKHLDTETAPLPDLNV